MRSTVYSLWSMVLITMLLSSTSCYAATVSSTELIAKANALDGESVTYKGEAVTAIMKRGVNSWINLNDGNNAIGVWCATKDLSEVSTLGGYKYEGDILEVSGVFHRACVIHGGELDIHAETVRVAIKGFPIKERIFVRRLNAAIAFFVLAILSIALLRKRI